MEKETKKRTFMYELVQAPTLWANKQWAARMAGEAQAEEPAIEGHVGSPVVDEGRSEAVKTWSFTSERWGVASGTNKRGKMLYVRQERKWY